MEAAMVRSGLMVAALLALMPLPAQAQYGRWHNDHASAEQAAQRQQQGTPPGRHREADRGERDRRNTLTPDERRELHRDLQRADREIYRKGKERPQRR
jgi:hypothetical protein